MPYARLSRQKIRDLAVGDTSNVFAVPSITDGIQWDKDMPYSIILSLVWKDSTARIWEAKNAVLRNVGDDGEVTIPNHGAQVYLRRTLWNVFSTRAKGRDDGIARL